MVETRSIEMFIAIFAIVISIPILYQTLPLIDFTLTTEEPFIIDLPRRIGAETNWAFDGTNNNTRTDELLRTEVSTIGGSPAAWNLGTFNFTTADRRNNSGILGIGYANGTGSGPLRLFLRLDGTTGSVHDFSGRGNDGTVVNTPIRGATGTFSTNAFDFQRADSDRVTVPNAASLNNFADEITIETWVYFDAVAQQRTLVRKNNAFRTFISTVGGATTLKCNINGNTFDTGIAPIANQWHHIACVYDETEVRVYLDGATVGTFPFTGGNVNNNGNPINIGADAGGTNAFDGRMDDIRIHRRAFNDQDIFRSIFFGTETFVGDYTSRVIDTPRPRAWKNITVNASIPTDTSATMDAVSLFDNGTEKDRDSFVLNDGVDTYTLSPSQKSPDFLLEFDGQSGRANASWEVTDALVRADVSLGASLVINNTSQSFTSGPVGEGIFTSDVFAPENVDDVNGEISVNVENVTTSALINGGTAINITLQTSDNNFTTVQEERIIEVDNGVDIIAPLPALNDTKYVRFDARLITDNANRTPALERVKIFTTVTEQEQFPSGGFSMERVIILLVIASFVFILFELLIHRER